METDSSSPALLLGIYCALILLASLAGGWIPILIKLTHVRLQLATSFVAGLMLGVAVLHLLPHAWHEMESIDLAAGWMLGSTAGPKVSHRSRLKEWESSLVI